MNEQTGQLVDDGRARLFLVATDPVWIGAVKRAAQRGGSGLPLSVEEVNSLSQVSPAPPAVCQLVFIEAVRSNIAEVARWLTSRRPLASSFRAVVMVSRADRDFSAVELGWATQWLREAGASHVVTSVWEIPEVLDVMHRRAAASGRSGPWERLPLPLEAEGWQPHRRGDRF